MNKTTWVVATLSLLAHTPAPAQNLHTGTAAGNQLQLSIQNGLSSFMANPSIDSVYFLKAGFNTGVQGNYYWNNFGVAGKVGYFANGTDKQALEDFARSRKAPRDRMMLATESFRGMYLFTGPAFQSTFNKWRIQSSFEGGLISKPASQVLIGDMGSPDIVYYRNVFDESNSFAWSAGLSVSYSITRQFLLGVNADYLNTKNEVVNYDILRGGGHEAKNITSQASFLNTGVRLSYLFNTRKGRDAGSGLASGKRTQETNNNGLMNSTASNAGKTQEQNTGDTCKCEDKVMNVKELSPYIVEIKFGSVSEAKEFLDTYEPLLEQREAGSGMSTGKRQHGSMSNIKSNPLYTESSKGGTNPLYEASTKEGANALYQSKRVDASASNTEGSKGVVQRNSKGELEFYLFPSIVDLAEVLSFDDGRVTVHVQNGIKSNDPGMTQRERGSGMASGRRTYKAITVGDVDGDGAPDLMLTSRATFSDGSTRDVTNDASIAWGSMIAVGDVDGDGRMDYTLQSSGNNKYHYTNGGVMHEDDWNSTAKRDVATGQSTGKRQHKPIRLHDLDNDGTDDMLLLSFNHEIKSPRDVATGQSSGKRSQTETDDPAFTWGSLIAIGDVDGDGFEDYCLQSSGSNKYHYTQGGIMYEDDWNSTAKRDAATGQSSGKRQHKPIRMRDLDSDGIDDMLIISYGYEVKAPRDVATGQASGKRTKIETGDPGLTWGSLVAAGDVDGDGRADYALLSTGSNKYRYTDGGIMHEDDWNSIAKRDAATGQATGKRQHKPVRMRDLDSDGIDDMLILSANHEIKSPRDVATGQSSGRVSKVDAFTIKQGIILEADLDGDGEYEPLGIKSPRDVATGQSSGKRTASKEDVYVWKIKYGPDLDGDGVPEAFVCSGENKDAVMVRSSTSKAFNLVVGEPGEEKKPVEKATSGIKQTMQTQVLMTNDSTGGNDNTQKAGISTSRSNIRTKRMVSCTNGICVMDCEIELNGRIYSALITARHETAKNSIGNIR